MSLSPEELRGLLDNDRSSDWLALATDNEADLEKILWWDKCFEAYCRNGLKTKAAMGASKRDTATQFGVSTRTLENVMKKVSNQLQKVRTFAAQNMKPRLDSHHGFVASIERAREIMQRDALYRDLLLTREPEGVVHIYAEAFVRAYKALQEASSRAAEMEKELKKYRTAEAVCEAGKTVSEQKPAPLPQAPSNFVSLTEKSPSFEVLLLDTRA